jgi:hypothetical protein
MKIGPCQGRWHRITERSERHSDRNKDRKAVNTFVITSFWQKGCPISKASSFKQEMKFGPSEERCNGITERYTERFWITDRKNSFRSNNWELCQWFWLRRSTRYTFSSCQLFDGRGHGITERCVREPALLTKLQARIHEDKQVNFVREVVTKNYWVLWDILWLIEKQ